MTGTLKGAPPASGDNTTVTLTVTPADADSTRYYLTNQDDEYTIQIDGGGTVDSNSNRTLTFNVIQDGKFFQDLVLTITAKADGFDTVTKTVTVLDDDQDVTLSFVEYDPQDADNTLDREANVSEGEGDEEAQEVVVHAWVMEAPRSSMDVPIMVSRNNSRYSVTGDMTIEIAADDNFGKTTLKITPVENDRFDDPVDITISVGAGLKARTIKVILSDNDEKKPKLMVKASPDKILEDGSDTQVVQVTATLDGDAVQKATKVTYEVTPENDGRYSVSGTMEVTIPAGSKTASTNLAFVPVKDAIFHRDLDIMVTGKSAPDYGSNAATVMLRDDDQELALTVSPSSVTETDVVADQAQKVTITATLPSATPKDMMVPLTVTMTQGRGAVDLDMPVITIDAGKVTGTAEITVTPTDNDQFNADADITVAVTEESGLAARSVAIKLTDDEKKPKLELALDETTVTEAEAGGQNIVATATLKGAPLATDVNTVVTFKVTPEDPDSTRYHISSNDGNTQMMTITGGGNTEDSNTTATFTFNATRDGKFFQDKVLTLTASADGFDSVSKTITVLDDDQDVTLSFATFDANASPSTSATVSEGDGDEEAQEVVVWVRAMEAPRNAMNVPIMVSRNRSRYNVTGDMTIEISAGFFLGKTTLKITPVENDRFDEPEDIVVSVGGGMNARNIKISLTDLDEKRPTLKVVASPDIVNENGSDTQIVQVTATLDGDAVQKATTVTFEVKPEEESRYGVSGTLEVTIPAGSKSASTNLSFVPVKDGIFNQDLMITVSGKSDPNYNPAVMEPPASDPPDSDVITLRDDDQEITLSVSPSSVMEMEDEDMANVPQTVEITATMDSPPARNVSVPLQVATNDRYTLGTGDEMPTITIDAGDPSGSVEITITPMRQCGLQRSTSPSRSVLRPTAILRRVRSISS